MPARRPSPPIANCCKGWQSDAHRITVVLDTELKALPADRAAWILGRTNRLAATLFGGRPGLRVDAAGIEVDGEKMPLAGHTLVATFRHPANVEKAIGWIVAEPVAALPGLGRKLPHYGKYSYLGFQGDEPANIIKGQWQQSDSPLSVDLRPESRRGRQARPASHGRPEGAGRAAAGVLAAGACASTWRFSRRPISRGAASEARASRRRRSTSPIGSRPTG